MSENQNQLLDEITRSPSQSQTIPPYRVLVVDDDDGLRQLNTEVLQQSGYVVDSAEDGDVAWGNLQQHSYDLLITDQKMARVSGIELLKKLRAARMELPVVMVTGTMPEAELALHPWLQPAAVLLKPYTIPELLGVVRDVLYAAECPREQINHLLAWRGQSSPVVLRK
jgi:DNA-binding response OmpR family regulator